MKFVKIAVLLFALVALLAIAMPAAAQAPTCPSQEALTNMWFVPRGCPVVRYALSGSTKLPAPFVYPSNGKYVTPFGGEPLTSAKFGTNGILPGGTTKQEGGDGTSALKAIYIGPAWDPNPSVRSDLGERPMEIPGCATVKVPAGTSRWFKAEGWENKNLLLWLDDELDGATSPSGSARFGGADLYMSGLNGAHPRAANAWDSPNTWTGYAVKTGPEIDGFVMAVYDPDNLKANDAFDAPNAALYTVNYSGGGSPRRSAPGYRGVSVFGVTGAGIHGYGTFNPNTPNHLLWYDGGNDPGWWNIRVYNQMIWDGTVSVCAYRSNR